MEQISQDKVRALASEEVRPGVSVYLPLHLTAAEKDQDRIRFRNLLDEAERRLLSGGLRGPAVKSMLRPAREMQEDRSFWRPSGIEGLAVLISDGLFRSFALPYRCPEAVSVSDRFTIGPLLHPLVGDDRFFLLGLSPKSILLFRCHGRDLERVELPAAMPKNIDEALAGTVIEKSLQHHTSASGGRAGPIVGIMHGQGSPKDDEKKLLVEYFRIVAKHLDKLLSGEDLPLVLAAVEYYHPMFQEICRYPHLLREGVNGSPDEMTPSELAERALPVAEPKFREELHQAARRYNDLVATQRTDDSIEEVLKATEQGRVETIFTELGTSIWGRYDAGGEKVEIHDNQEEGDVDLLELALAKSILSGGSAYVVESGDMPGDEPVAAIYRW